MDLVLDCLIISKGRPIQIQILWFELSSATTILHCLLQTVFSLGQKQQSEYEASFLTFIASFLKFIVSIFLMQRLLMLVAFCQYWYQLSSSLNLQANMNLREKLHCIQPDRA